MDKYTTLQKVWYCYHTGNKGKRKHLELKFACTNCRHVWDKQAYAFNYCPYCGLRVTEIEDAVIVPPERREENL